MPDIQITIAYRSLTATMTATSELGKKWMKICFDSNDGVHYFHKDTLEDMIELLRADHIDVDVN